MRMHDFVWRERPCGSPQPATPEVVYTFVQAHSATGAFAVYVEAAITLDQAVGRRSCTSSVEVAADENTSG
jgi:hypothetical protein